QESKTKQSCLFDQAFTAAVGAALDAQLVEDRPRERANTAAPPAQLVVEVEHGRHQARTKLEKTGQPTPARQGGLEGPLEQHDPFDPREPPDRPRQGRGEARQPLLSRDDLGTDERAAGGGALFDREPQQHAGRASWHDDRAAAGGERWTFEREVDERVPERREVARANEKPPLHRATSLSSRSAVGYGPRANRRPALTRGLKTPGYMCWLRWGQPSRLKPGPPRVALPCARP